MQGLFVSIEGGEGAGKTTLIQGLNQTLSEKGVPVLMTREPGGSPLGEEIRKILLGHHKIVDKAELLLFLAARAQHYEETILPALLQGKVVLCDRFHDSTIAYQGLARGVGEDIVTQLCAFSTDGRYPDLTFYLDIDPEVGLNRAHSVRTKDRIEAETLHFHQKVREAFKKLMREDAHRCTIIDASQPQMKVLEDTLGFIHAHLSHR